MAKQKVRFVMKLTDGGFELLEGKWPVKEGSLYNGYCELQNGTKKECQAVGNGPGESPTFYWGW